VESLHACRDLALGLLDWKPCDSRAFGLPSELTKATVHGCQWGQSYLRRAAKTSSKCENAARQRTKSLSHSSSRRANQIVLQVGLPSDHLVDGLAFPVALRRPD
jgi:hypothetical protein